MILSKPAAVHVSLRVTSHVWSLRGLRCFRVIEGSFAEARGRFGLRIIEFSVMDKHLHLFVEADDDLALSRGIQGLRLRITRELNRVMGRRGAVFADRHHARVLGSPNEYVTAMADLLGSAAQQYGAEGAEAFSSAAYDNQKRERVLSSARTWLLIAGWRRRMPVELQAISGFAAGSPTATSPPPSPSTLTTTSRITSTIPSGPAPRSRAA